MSAEPRVQFGGTKAPFPEVPIRGNLSLPRPPFNRLTVQASQNLRSVLAVEQRFKAHLSPSSRASLGQNPLKRSPSPQRGLQIGKPQVGLPRDRAFQNHARRVGNRISGFPCSNFPALYSARKQASALFSVVPAPDTG